MLFVRMVRGFLFHTTYRWRFILAMEDWLRKTVQEIGHAWLMYVWLIAVPVSLVCGVIDLTWMLRLGPNVFADGLSGALLFATLIWMWILTPFVANLQIHWWKALKDADRFAAKGL